MNIQYDKNDLYDVFLEYCEILSDRMSEKFPEYTGREVAIKNWLIDEKNFPEVKEFFSDHEFELDSNEIIQEFVLENPEIWY